MFEPDYQNLKVICQQCGKIGIVDTSKYQNGKSPFFLRYDCGRRGREFGEWHYDIFLCAECLGVETKK